MTVRSIVARLMPLVHFAQRRLLTLVAIGWIAILGLVVREAWTSRADHTKSLLARHVEIARSGAGQIANFLSNIENEARSTLLPLGDDWREANRLAALRLFRESPAVRTVYRLSADGTEQHEISQIRIDRDRSGEHWGRRWPLRAGEPGLVAGVLGERRRLVAEKGARSEELFLQIALSGHARELGITIIVLDLRLLWDQVRAIRVGQRGQGYVVDPTGRVLANRDMDLVLNSENVKALAYVKDALRQSREHAAGALGLYDTGIAAEAVLAAFSRLPTPHDQLGWLVLVEEPTADAYAPFRSSLWTTVILLLGSLGVATAIGGVLVRRSHELEKRVGELHALNEVSDAVNATLDNWESVLETIVEKAVERSGTDAGTIYEVDEANQRLRFVKNHRMEQSLIAELERERERERSQADDNVSFVWAAVKRRTTLQIEDLRRERLQPVGTLLDKAGYRALLIVPLVRGDVVFGALVLRRRQPGGFPDETVEMIETIAGQLSLTLHNARLFKEARQHRSEIEKALTLTEALLPQELVRIVKADGFEALQPQRREVTLVFFDLRNFTASARSLEPEAIHTALAAYHAAIGPLVFEHGGTLERFTGDQILVIFNAPMPIERPLERAVELAIRAREASTSLVADWQRNGLDLGVGTAIDQDHATCGLIGFEGRYDYAAIGNVTNRGSRLCGAAKAGQILATRRVVAGLGDKIEAKAFGRLQLKGLSEPLEAFEILGRGLDDARGAAVPDKSRDARPVP